MTTRTSIPSYEGCGFPDTRIVRFITALKDARFSGQLVWVAVGDQRKWIFYFYLGTLCYVTGGTHLVRRWVRNLAVYCPHVQVNLAQLQHDLYKATPASLVFGWEYYLLNLWVEQYQLKQEQAGWVIQAIFSEVLLEMLHVPDLTYQIKPLSSALRPLVALDGQKTVAELQKIRQNLQDYNIDVAVLNKAPVVRHPERLLGRMALEAFQALPKLLDGEKTLRDLANQARIDVVQATRSLLPHIQSGLIELVHVADLPEPIYSAMPQPASVAETSFGNASPLIACVDDSAIVCWTMEKLLTTAGYRFIAINDGFRAITTLLQHKPSLIFLDVLMPGTNGYEICRNLRKAHSFRDTPIVFLTGLDGVVDQVRARLAGASDFLSKPIDREKVLSITTKYVTKEAMAP